MSTTTVVDSCTHDYCSFTQDPLHYERLSNPIRDEGNY